MREGGTSLAAVVNRTTVSCELVTSSEPEDHLVCLKERNPIAVICSFPAEPLEEMSRTTSVAVRVMSDKRRSMGSVELAATRHHHREFDAPMMCAVRRSFLGQIASSVRVVVTEHRPPRC